MGNVFQDDKDELCKFVNALGDSNEKNKPTTPEPDDLSGSNAWSVTSEPSLSDTGVWSDGTSSDIWVDITDALDHWMASLIDVETRISTHKSLKSHRINQSIDRMVGDGLISICEANDLRFVGDSWMRLLDTYSLYSAVGSQSYKREIFSTLIDLYSAKQITKELFLRICNELV